MARALLVGFGRRVVGGERPKRADPFDVGDSRRLDCSLDVPGETLIDVTVLSATRGLFDGGALSDCAKKGAALIKCWAR